MNLVPRVLSFAVPPSLSKGREGEDPRNEVESKCETAVIVICSPSNKNQN